VSAPETRPPTVAWLRRPTRNRARRIVVDLDVAKFLLWLILFILCWPVAILAVLLYPVVWVLLLPFRLVGVAVDGVFAFLRALFHLPAKLLGART
jgi:hypothetical protein